MTIVIILVYSIREEEEERHVYCSLCTQLRPTYRYDIKLSGQNPPHTVPHNVLVYYSRMFLSNFLNYVNPDLTRLRPNFHPNVFLTNLQLKSLCY